MSIALVIVSTDCGDDDSGAQPEQADAGADHSRRDASLSLPDAGHLETKDAGNLHDAGDAALLDASACDGGACLDSGAARCTTCLKHEISWRIVRDGYSMATVFDGTRFKASGCNDLTIRPVGGSACKSELPRCVDFPASVEALNAAFADPEVKEIFAGDPDASEALRGDSFVYEITLDGSDIEYQACSPGRLDVECVQPHPGLEALRLTLDAIAALARCDGTPAADCDSPYDPGAGDAGVIQYWHDPLSRTCLPREYAGHGGNRNRYDSAELCALSCPRPRNAEECGPDRDFVPEVLLDCSQPPPLIEPRCLKRCAGDEDCKHEVPAWPTASVPPCDMMAGHCSQQSTTCL